MTSRIAFFAHLGPWRWTSIGLLLAGLALAGCGAPRDVQEKDSANQILWMRHLSAPERSQPATLQKLVGLLESDDPAVRLFAIHTLEGISGQSFGYVHYADEAQRQEAVARWRAWLASRSGGPTTRTTAPAVP